ncbi:Oidioi.mRNA.OKI2018_I69.chr1.g1307.t1.cds [Oikopleura dioica]|uniref:Oidioi.mRNA.OKI2018_I69.chr1.g1307.t1.cds n=1 Tax=Oikopleura dioica TaxID=34765 RepID=A0ABN7STV1_OIKDI|nr:Oidioi.mRNA.OKI2018_I69.chr1.g1307.t1.cds [Oikopleura dioica]
MSAPYPTQNNTGRNSYGVNSSDLPPMAGGGFNPSAPPPPQNPHFQQNPGYPSYPPQGPPQNSGYPSYPPQNQGHNPYPSAQPQNYGHQPNHYHQNENPHFQGHQHHQGYNQGYPQAQEHNDTKKKKKNKGLLGQVEGLVSDVIGGGSKSHGSYGGQGQYSGQQHGQQYGHVSQGHPQQQKQKGSILDSGKEMAMWALEAKMMHGGMGKKMKYDMKKNMFNAVTKGFK